MAFQSARCQPRCESFSPHSTTRLAGMGGVGRRMAPLKLQKLAAMLILSVLIAGGSGVQGAPLFPMCFVFGDSLADPGNNNFLPWTLSKANFPYNGVDFPGGQATGRFSNGRTVVDVLTRHLGFPSFLPAYLDPDTAGSKLLHGVNYASGAGGILNTTGANFIQTLPLESQISFFQRTIGRIKDEVGGAKQTRLLEKALYVVIVGSNDYINNYFLKGSATKAQYPNSSDYRDVLISTFKKHLATLHSLGARKFLVTGVGPLGCLPSQLAGLLLSGFDAPSSGFCLSSVNQIIQDYNSALQTLLSTLSHDLTNSTFLYADSYHAVLHMVQNPSSYGLEVVNRGCCGAGPFNGVLPCDQYLGAAVCPERSKFLFWDPFHPSDAANVILGTGLFNGTSGETKPLNVQQLARL